MQIKINSFDNMINKVFNQVINKIITKFKILTKSKNNL